MIAGQLCLPEMSECIQDAGSAMRVTLRGSLPTPAPAASPIGAMSPQIDVTRPSPMSTSITCLEEIPAILGAFDDDCGEVQTPLRELIDGKIASAQRRVAELVALTAQLHGARHALATTAAPGPCGPGCARVDEGPPAARSSLTMVQLTGSAPDISCSLSHEQTSDRVSEWQAVLAHVRERSSCWRRFSELRNEGKPMRVTGRGCVRRPLG